MAVSPHIFHHKYLVCYLSTQIPSICYCQHKYLLSAICQHKYLLHVSAICQLKYLLSAFFLDPFLLSHSTPKHSHIMHIEYVKLFYIWQHFVFKSAWCTIHNQLCHRSTTFLGMLWLLSMQNVSQKAVHSVLFLPGLFTQSLIFLPGMCSIWPTAFLDTFWITSMKVSSSYSEQEYVNFWIIYDYNVAPETYLYKGYDLCV